MPGLVKDLSGVRKLKETLRRFRGAGGGNSGRARCGDGVDGDAVRGVRGETLDLERRALGLGVCRELGVEPLDDGDRECVNEPNVRVLEVGAEDRERRVVELSLDLLGRQTARPRWW